jgi:hypothetical protein
MIRPGYPYCRRHCGRNHPVCDHRSPGRDCPAEADANVAVQANIEGPAGELDQPAPVISAIEPTPIDASTSSAIQPADAIVVEITQSVTVAVPGQKSEDNEEVEHTGATSPEHAATEPALIPDTETLALDGVN